MTKIKDVKYDNQYIELETTDKYIYKIPNNNAYIRNLLYKGISENKSLYKDIKYYDKCADICILPIWVSVAFIIYGLTSNFILLDLLYMCCGAITSLSLIGTSIFKIVSNNLKKEANNNEYFTKIYEYAKSGGKINNKQTKAVKHTSKTNQQNEIKTKQTVQNHTTNYNNYYNLNKNEIIQDEEVHQRKR